MKITNKLGIDKLVEKAATSDYQYKPKQYSVTSILTDPKDIILKRRHNNEIVKDVSEMSWLLFGTAFHEFMERQEDDYVEVNEQIYHTFKDICLDAKEEYSVIKGSIETKCCYYLKPKLKEQRLEYKCKNSPYTLTGYSDLYNVLTNEIADYKTASVNKTLYSDWDDYIKQLKLYAFMLNSMGFPCNRGKLIIFLKDWSQSAHARDPKNYPACPMYEISWEFTYEEIMMEGRWIEDYFMRLNDIENLADDELEICSDEVRKFGKKPTFAVMKNDNKRAIKVCETYADACEYIRYNKLDHSKDKHWIQERKAEDSRCMLYCDSAPFCNHFVKNFAKVHLVDSENKAVVGFANMEKANLFLSVNPEYQNLKIIEIEREVKENE